MMIGPITELKERIRDRKAARKRCEEAKAAIASAEKTYKDASAAFHTADDRYHESISVFLETLEKLDGDEQPRRGREFI